MNRLPPRLRFLRLRHHELLVALGDTANLHKAAQALSVSQPAVTKMLQDLETQLGCVLFERLPRGVRSTPAGEVAMRHARLALAQAQRLGLEMEALRTGEHGTVRLGSIMASAPVLLAQAIAGVKTNYPSLQISVVVETSDVLLRELRDGRLDLVVGRLTPECRPEDFRFELLDDEALSVVARRDHPLATRSALQLRELAGLTWIVQPRGSPMRELLEAEFTENGLAMPTHRVETASILTTTSLIQRTDMVGVIPTSVANHYAGQAWLSILAIRWRRRLPPYGLISPAGEALSRAAEIVRAALLDLVESRIAGERPSTP